MARAGGGRYPGSALSPVAAGREEDGRASMPARLPWQPSAVLPTVPGSIPNQGAFDPLSGSAMLAGISPYPPRPSTP